MANDLPTSHNWLQLLEVLRDDANQLESIAINLRVAIDQIKASFNVIENLIRLIQEADTRQEAHANEQ